MTTISTKNGGACLVAGSLKQKEGTMLVKITGATRCQGKSVAEGEVLTVNNQEGRALIAAGKAEEIHDEPKARAAKSYETRDAAPANESQPPKKKGKKGKKDKSE